MTSSARRRRGAPPAGERLTRDKVITSATELIERDGLTAFGMRTLAARLGVRPGALYNHVEALDDLLDAVAARFVAGFDLADTEASWPDWIRATAARLRRRMLDRPELTDLVLARAPGTAAGPEFMHSFLDRLVRAGVSPAVAHVAWHTVLTVVIGSVRQERARRRNQADTFEAVLDVAIEGLAIAAARPPDDRIVTLLHDHAAEHRS